ncbi:hypothetical protein [Halpernia sp.]|uniref:hypothetical protein n=1 Tax=Halpernia sp. TaxID=2782209 RepID=UPI003A9550EA
MKKVFYLFSILFYLISCKSINPTDHIGTWKINESYVDSGDGSGKPEIIKSDRRITFKSDGTFTSKGNFCSMNNDSKINGSGTYKKTPRIDYDTNFYLLKCRTNKISASFSINDGYLYIYYYCKEECYQKFEKTSNK